MICHPAAAVVALGCKLKASSAAPQVPVLGDQDVVQCAEFEAVFCCMLIERLTLFPSSTAATLRCLSCCSAWPRMDLSEWSGFKQR